MRSRNCRRSSSDGFSASAAQRYVSVKFVRRPVGNADACALANNEKLAGGDVISCDCAVIGAQPDCPFPDKKTPDPDGKAKPVSINIRTWVALLFGPRTISELTWLCRT